METQRNFIGLIGLGYWGKNILRNLYELDVLHTACDNSHEIIAQRRERFPDINFSTSYEELLSNPEIKAIAVASPAVTHYEFVKKALNAGKDVFVEKPLALKVEEGEDLVALAREKNLILMVGHILMYHAAVIKLKEIITSGELGKIQYIYSNRLNIGKLRVEENILWSFAPHDLSVILHLLEEEPERVFAFGGDYLNQGIYDTTLSTMEFRNGVKAHMFVCWLNPFKEQKLIVIGSEAMVVFDDVSSEKLFFYPHKIEWRDGKIPVAQKADHEVIPFVQTEPLKEELKHFIDCVNSRAIPKTDGNEGLKILRILDTLEHSIKNRTCEEIKHKVNY